MLDENFTPASIPDYVLSSICGGDPGTETTNASALGLFNLESGAWDRDVIDALGLSGLQLPTIRQPGEIVGYYYAGSRRIPCYTPLGDFQCALLGALLNPDELSLNISTGAQVSRLTSRLNLGDHQTRPFFGGQYINTYSNVPGGRALNVLLGLLTDFATDQKSASSAADPWVLIANAVNNARNTTLTVDPCFFEGAAGPGGSIQNIRGDNLTVGNLFRASFDAMASIYHSFTPRLWPETIARQHGHEWYPGSLTNWTARDLRVPLSFLGSGRYEAEIYEDAADAEHNPKDGSIRRQIVQGSETLTFHLASGGGCAIRFVPEG